MRTGLMHLQPVGSRFLDAMGGIGRVIFFFLEICRCAAIKRPSRRLMGQQLYFVGVQSLPVVLATGAFTGMVLAFSTYEEFKALGVTSWVGPLVSKGLTQQLAPTLVGLMLAGRVGCAMAAELGYMATSEQIDALKTMGTNPIGHLALPRVLALTTMMPLLTGFAMLIGIAGGLGLAVHGLGAEWHFIWTKTTDFMEPFDFVRGLIKAFFFGLTTSVISCYKGIHARGGAEGVGKATTQANVHSCITILVVNLFLTMVLGMMVEK